MIALLAALVLFGATPTPEAIDGPPTSCFRVEAHAPAARDWADGSTRVHGFGLARCETPAVRVLIVALEARPPGGDWRLASSRVDAADDTRLSANPEYRACAAETAWEWRSVARLRAEDGRIYRVESDPTVPENYGGVAESLMTC